MPTAFMERPAVVEPPRKRWTRAEFEAIPMVSDELEHVELVEGELISTMSKGRPHVNALILLQGWLVQVFGLRFVNPEASIEVSPEDGLFSLPQPDLSVTNRDISHFKASHPGPEDLRLVVEIAATSLGFDLTTKAPLYARAGIPEYWVLDIAGRRMIVHREPREGEFCSVEAYSEEESVAPLAAPESSLRVGDLFV